MNDLWPWLAVAGTGALHGLNPASGWVCLRHRRDLATLLVAHLAAVAVVAGLVALALAQGVLLEPLVLQALGLMLLAGMALHHLGRHGWRWPGGGGALAAWSFALGLVHGTGWMLVPSLTPLCLGDTPAREISAAGSMVLSGGAVLLHLGAMALAMRLANAYAHKLLRTLSFLRGAWPPRVASCHPSNDKANSSCPSCSSQAAPRNGRARPRCSTR